MQLDLSGPAGACLSHYLDPDISAPIAVGFSGGSDSLAALVATVAYGQAHGRKVLALTVDHGLQAASRQWTQQCASLAAELGADPVSLVWDTERPQTASGLPAQARRARHRLLAQAARNRGANILVLGHTHNDQTEADWMRQRGTNLGQLRPWSPSPAWPQGRGVFLLRPVLGLERQDLRDALTRRGLDWIDDPANSDVRYARSRARLAIADGAQRQDAPRVSMPDTACYWPKDLGPYTHIGGLCLDRQSLRSSDAPIGAFLARALLCVSGETRPVRGHSLARLEAAIRSPDEFALTLSGVKVTGAQTLWMTREGPRAAANKTTLAPCLLDDGVWDGRFEVGGRGPDQTLLALKGHGASLSPADRARLAAIAAVLRPSLPVTFDGSAKPYLPHFSGEPIAPNLPGITLHSLVLQRLRAACGQVYTERDLRITP